MPTSPADGPIGWRLLTNMRFMRRTYLSHKKIPNGSRCSVTFTLVFSLVATSDLNGIYIVHCNHYSFLVFSLIQFLLCRFDVFNTFRNENCAWKHAQFYGYFKSTVVVCAIKQVHCPCAYWWWMSLPFQTVGSMSRRLSVSKACSRSLTPWGFG